MLEVLAFAAVLLAVAPAFCWENMLTPDLMKGNWDEGNWWRYRVEASQYPYGTYKLTEKVLVDSVGYGFVEQFLRPPTIRLDNGQRYALSAVTQAAVKLKFTFLLTPDENVVAHFITNSLIPQSVSPPTGYCGPGQSFVPTPQAIRGVYLVTENYVIQYSDTIPVAVLPRKGDSTVQALMSERDYFVSANGGYGELRLYSQSQPADLRSDSVSLWAPYYVTCGCYSDLAIFKREFGLVGLRRCRCSDAMVACGSGGTSLILEAIGSPRGIHTRPSGRRGIRLAATSSSASTSLLFSINGRAAGVGIDGVRERGSSHILLRHEASGWRRFIP